MSGVRWPVYLLVGPATPFRIGDLPAANAADTALLLAQLLHAAADRMEDEAEDFADWAREWNEELEWP
jgi:hypothetical protein